MKAPATYEDLLKVSEHLVAEIIGGELHTTPRHAHAHSCLLGALHGPMASGRGGPGGWRILTAPELHLGHEVLVPDLAGWRRERLPVLPEEAARSMRAKTSAMRGWWIPSHERSKSSASKVDGG